MCCQLEVSALGLATRLRRCVWSRNLVNEETLAHWGLLLQKKEMEDSGEMLEEPAGLVRIYKLFLPSLNMERLLTVIITVALNWCRLRYACLRFPSVQLLPSIMCEVTGSTVVFLWSCITNGSLTRVERFTDGILLFIIEGCLRTSFYVRVERRERKNVTYKRGRDSYL